MGKKDKGFLVAINNSLKPAEKLYRKTKKLLKIVKNKVPAVFEEIESVIKSNLINYEDGKNLQKSPDLDKFTELLSSEITRKLPNINEKQLKKIVKDSSNESFLDMLTRGLGGEEERDITKIKKEKLFKRVLIANRGEIAIRVLRACRELGIEAVSVYTKQDEKALVVKFADKKFKLGNKASDYLDMNKIIKAAKKTKSDAIHPGYGFLAENADFAKMCAINKIKFIGPSSKAILAMGDKINAKKLIKNNSVPVLEGINRVILDVKEGEKIANEIGFPVIIKASAGGGGKGMRIVKKEEDFKNLFEACQTEAEGAFKNKDVFIEKYVEEPRHVEFQILSDSYGNVVHLGERDCSIQRRHQKLLEEAPSPALNEDLREKMGEAALKVAKAVKYEGAGTVEFLLDKSNKFYFMEMNTRIQVEHGITEMITGIDIVKEQIKIAAGAELAYDQEDIGISGWAIECRINAECPAEGFCPQTGTISNYLPPGGPGIRICSSSHQGQEISPYYDSLIAKLMCYGKTREEALDRMRRALNEFIIEGVDTTVPIFKIILANKAFQEGNVTTSFLEKEKIMEQVVKEHHKEKKSLTKDEKAIIITTAVSKYLEKKDRFNDKNSTWAQVARQEAVFNE